MQVKELVDETLTLLPAYTQDPWGRASTTERIWKRGNQFTGRKSVSQPFLLESKLVIVLRRREGSSGSGRRERCLLPEKMPCHQPTQPLVQPSSSSTIAPLTLMHSQQQNDPCSILLLSSQRKQPCPCQDVPKVKEDGLSLFLVGKDC